MQKKKHVQAGAWMCRVFPVCEQIAWGCGVFELGKRRLKIFDSVWREKHARHEPEVAFFPIREMSVWSAVFLGYFELSRKWFLTVRRGKKCEWPRARGLKMLKASSKLRGCAIFYQAVRVGMWNTAFWCILRRAELFRLESAVPSSRNDVMGMLQPVAMYFQDWVSR